MVEAKWALREKMMSEDAFYFKEFAPVKFHSLCRTAPAHPFPGPLHVWQVVAWQDSGQCQRPGEVNEDADDQDVFTV